MNLQEALEKQEGRPVKLKALDHAPYDILRELGQITHVICFCCDGVGHHGMTVDARTMRVLSVAGCGKCDASGYIATYLCSN